MKRKSTKKYVLLLIMGIILLGLEAGLIVLLNQPLKKAESNPPTTKTTTTTTTTKPRLKIVDPDSKSRNIAVMINNIKTVWGYQSGLQDAYLVYEIITEGGISRLMAVFKDQKTERIGTVRSSRIYFLDYALENDAIYMHVGGSKEAMSDIHTLNIPSIDGYGIFRDRTIGLAYEHTAFTSMSNIESQIAKRKFRTTANKPLLLDYSVDPIDLANEDKAISATDIYISYSSIKSTRYKYDATRQVYLRYQNDIPHVDYVTKEQYTVKNIITYQVHNSSYDSYGRQKLDNLGQGSGYYITNGYAIPITWEKKDRSSQTIYRKLNGEKLVVNDGNTFIQIQPQKRELTIK